MNALIAVRSIYETSFGGLPVKALFLLFFICASCAYRQGAPERAVPGGFRQVRVPMFKNLSREVGIETSFTNAMIDELLRSRVATINPDADVEVLGAIESVQYFPSGNNPIGNIGVDRPVLASDYRVVIVMDLSVKKKSDDKLLWSGKFTGQRTFSAARITAPVVNSANPLYNLSARRRNISALAQDMVVEATDKMTENF
jgi:hypothetical protein